MFLDRVKQLSIQVRNIFKTDLFSEIVLAEQKIIYKKDRKYSKSVIFLDLIERLVAEIADFVSICRVISSSVGVDLSGENIGGRDSAPVLSDAINGEVNDR